MDGSFLLLVNRFAHPLNVRPPMGRRQRAHHCYWMRKGVACWTSLSHGKGVGERQAALGVMLVMLWATADSKCSYGSIRDAFYCYPLHRAWGGWGCCIMGIIFTQAVISPQSVSAHTLINTHTYRHTHTLCVILLWSTSAAPTKSFTSLWGTGAPAFSDVMKLLKLIDHLKKTLF